MEGSHPMTFNAIRAVLTATALLTGSAAQAQAYPDKPVTFVVPFGPGASSDIFARYLATELSKNWGQPVNVENMPGAGGTIGTTSVARAEPDGYRILFLTSTYTTNAAAQKDLPFDPRADLQPVMKYADGDLIMVSGPRVLLKSLEDLIREARAQTIFFGATGPASTPTFLAKLVSDAADIPMEGVYFTGGAEAMLDVIAGRVDIYIGTVTTVLSSVQSGQLSGMVVFGAERSASLPDVPTIAEAGFPEATTAFWFGIFAPAGLPEDVLAKLNADITAVMQRPETAELFAAQGARPAPSSVAEFTRLIDAELIRWGELASKFNITTD